MAENIKHEKQEKVVTKKKSNGWTWVVYLLAGVFLIFMLNYLNIWPFNDKTADVDVKKKDKKEVPKEVYLDDGSKESLSIRVGELTDSIEILNQRLAQGGRDIVPHVSKWTYKQPTKRKTANVSYSPTRRKTRWWDVKDRLSPIVVIPPQPVDTSTRLESMEIINVNGKFMLKKTYSRGIIVPPAPSTSGSY